MPALDATVGGASANSYVTLAEAEDYFDRRYLTAEWDALATNADKERVLMGAAIRLDEITWVGTRVSTGQALQWPRAGAINLDGDEYDWAVIPTPVKNAQCELALAMLRGGGADITATDELRKFKSLPTPDGALVPNLDNSEDSLVANVERLIAHLRRAVGAGPRIIRS